MQSDDRLVALARAGSDAAFEAIVERYRGPLTGYCTRFIDADRAEDVAQQTLIKALEMIREDDRPLQLKAWLYRVAHNYALKVIEKKGYDYEQLDEQYDGVRQPPASVEQAEKLRDVVKTMLGMPERERRALAMREMEGRSYAEVAGVLDTTTGGLEQLLYRARTKLRDALGALLPLPLLRAWLSRSGDGIGQATAVGGSAAATGGGSFLLKVGVVIVLAGATVAGVGLVNDQRRSGSATAAEQGVSPSTPALASTSTPTSTGAGDKLAKAGAPSSSGPAPTYSSPRSHKTEQPTEGSRKRRKAARPTTDTSSDGQGETGLAATTSSADPGGASSSQPPSVGWQAPLALSSSGQDSNSPAVALDGQGNAHAVWRSNDGANWRVQATSAGLARSAPTVETLSDPGQDARGPAIASDATGNTVVAWLRSDGTNDRVEASYQPAGGSFGAPQLLSPAGVDAAHLSLVRSPAGKFAIAWTRSDGGIEIRQGQDGDFAPIQSIAETAGPLSITFDARGDLVAAWVAATGVRSAVDAAGASDFDAPQTISGPSERPGGALFLSGEAGGVAVSWADTRLGTLSVATRAAGASFSAPETLPDPVSATPAAVSVTTDGHAAATWYSKSGLSVATRIPGESFKTAGTLPSGVNPSVGIDQAGNALVLFANSDEQGWHVDCAYVHAGGKIETPKVISNPGASGSAIDFRLAFDPAGNAAAIWSHAPTAASAKQIQLARFTAGT